MRGIHALNYTLFQVEKKNIHRIVNHARVHMYIFCFIQSNHNLKRRHYMFIFLLMRRKPSVSLI